MGGTVILVVVGLVLVIGLGLWLVGERGRPMRGSTWRMLRAGGLRRIFDFSGLHGYVYGRWTNRYIRLLLKLVPRLSPRRREWLAERYHGKLLTGEQAEAVIRVDRDIPLQDLDQVIPYSRARNLVLQGPPDLAVFECACRHARDNPCQPTQVCLVVGQPFVGFILEHHPKTSRRLTQAEALELLHAEHERGHLHSAWFKDACLDRFYSICNCCRCCCGGIQAMTRLGMPMLSSSGYVARVDEAACAACGTCAEACPFEAIQVNGRAVVNWERCMGCEVCVGQCPNKALSLVRDERKGLPLDVRLLSRTG